MWGVPIGLGIEFDCLSVCIYLTSFVVQIVQPRTLHSYCVFPRRGGGGVQLEITCLIDKYNFNTISTSINTSIDGINPVFRALERPGDVSIPFFY